MTKINFGKEQKAPVVARVKTYFETELDQDIGGFEAGFLMNFFSEEIGAHILL